jgi:hypothetical protein
VSFPAEAARKTSGARRDTPTSHGNLRPPAVLPPRLDELRLEDPTIYQWRFTPEKQHPLQILLAILSVVVLLPGLIWLASGVLLWLPDLLFADVPWLRDLLPAWHRLFFWITFALSTLCFLGYVGLLLAALLGARGATPRFNSTGPPLALLGLALLVPALAVPGSSLAADFQGQQDTGYLGWVLYLLDNVLGAVLFDIPDVIFHYKLSTTAPGGVLSGVVVCGMRLLILAATIQFAWQIYAQERHGKVFYGTFRECLSECANLPPAERTRLILLARVEPFADAQQVPVPELLKKYPNLD